MECSFNCGDLTTKNNNIVVAQHVYNNDFGIYIVKLAQNTIAKSAIVMCCADRDPVCKSFIQGSINYGATTSYDMNISITNNSASIFNYYTVEL